MSNLRFREYYKRRLPHIQIPGATYFVTFRLKDSLPLKILEQLAQDTEKINGLPLELQESGHRRWFGRFDDILDRCLAGEQFLTNEQVRAIVTDALRRRDGSIYHLLAFCIMPNHVHVVFTPLEKLNGSYHSLTEILHSLKRNSAKQANLCLGRSGPFWQDESYDHFVRDESELDRIIKYVLYNPVKAGLVPEWTDWPGTYSKFPY
ncbi:MAG: transposase [Anaerolineales bacterium]|jgi:REP element-mobilizing transposase RayT|nr:transposase [Anaerolineales bacterium]